MDLTDHTTSDEKRLIKWELPHEPFNANGKSYRFRRHPHKVLRFEYTKLYQIVKPSLKARINKGDMVIVMHNHKASKLIQGCKAIVRDRYRIVKYKPFGIFRDYFAVIELLEGRLTGEIRKVLPAVLKKLKR